MLRFGLVGLGKCEMGQGDVHSSYLARAGDKH